MTFFLKKHADQIGILASGLCLVHCLLMPILTMVWLQHDHCANEHCPHDEGFNYDYLFLAFSALAVWLASGHCSRPWLKAMMWACFALLATGLLLEFYFAAAHTLALFAAVGLAVAHLLNRRFCHQCKHRQEK